MYTIYRTIRSYAISSDNARALNGVRTSKESVNCLPLSRREAVGHTSNLLFGVKRSDRRRAAMKFRTQTKTISHRVRSSSEVDPRTDSSSRDLGTATCYQNLCFRIFFVSFKTIRRTTLLTRKTLLSTTLTNDDVFFFFY